MTPDEAFESLRHGMEASRLAHAYVIEGAPRGNAGKLAERVLDLMFCESAKKPCGECRACRQNAQHAYPDALWVEPQKKSRLISVEQVRELQQLIFQTAFAGGWKACVIVGADRLGAEAANAFLKTLEEPPDKCVFFLLTDSPQSLLPTVMSRCQQISLSGDDDSLKQEWRATLDTILITGAAGNPVAAMAKAERLQRLLREMKAAARAIEEEKSSSTETDEDDDTIEARAEALYREWRKAVMLRMLHWYRDILILSAGADDKLALNSAGIDDLTKKAGSTTIPAAVRDVQTVEEMNRQFESNLPEGLVLNYGFARLS